MFVGELGADTLLSMLQRVAVLQYVVGSSLCSTSSTLVAGQACTITPLASLIAILMHDVWREQKASRRVTCMYWNTDWAVLRRNACG